MKVLAGTSNTRLCKAIARQLKLKLVNSHIRRFADGEVYIEINENNINILLIFIKNLINISCYDIAINMAKKDCNLLNINYEYLYLL